MKDLALGKNVLEFCNHPHHMTEEGDNMDYNTLTGGYLGIHHPSFITLDLEKVVAIKQISMKLIDWDDDCNKSEPRNTKQHYAYRLLYSEDKLTWTILYDTTATDKVYRRGWQWGVFDQPIRMRYFRIHALHNPANSGFHVVRLRLFDEENPTLQIGDRLDIQTPYSLEVGDAVPISTRIMNLVQRLSDTVSESHKQTNDYKSLVNEVLGESMVFDTVDGRVDQFRQIITPYVAGNLKSDYEKDSFQNITSWVVSGLMLGLNIIFDIFQTQHAPQVIFLRWLFFIITLAYALYLVKDNLKSFLFSKKHHGKTISQTPGVETKNRLNADTISSLRHTDGAEVPMFLFNDTVGDYNTQTGFHKIPNPGYLEIILKEDIKISYFRFLLWDNCGTLKQQPSRRKYHYRMLLGRSSENGGIIWEAVYDNSLNPSNGWQEFFFENGARQIKAIKLQFLHTLALSNKNNGNTVTQLVSIQAYENPTENICRWTDACPRSMYAIPTKGLSRNKIIIGGSDFNIGYMAESKITSKINLYLLQLEHECFDSSEADKIRKLRNDLQPNTNDDISRQIDIFCNSLLTPVNERRTALKKKSVWISFVTIVLLSIEFLDISDSHKLIILSVISVLVIFLAFRKKLLDRKNQSV